MTNLHQQVQRTERLTEHVNDTLHDDRFWLADLVGSFVGLFIWW